MQCQKETITIKTWGQHDKFCKENMITVKATKNTYDSKEGLKDNGFGWNKEEKCWERTFENMEEYNRFMEHFMNVTYYGRRVVNKCHALVEFEVIEEEDVKEETAETSEIITDNMEANEMETVAERMSAIGGGVKCEVINAVELDGAVMYAIKVDGCLTTCAIVYDDGTLFCQWDWQGAHPETAEEIADYDWRTEDGRRAVMLDGMPRML